MGVPRARDPSKEMKEELFRLLHHQKHQPDCDRQHFDQQGEGCKLLKWPTREQDVMMQSEFVNRYQGRTDVKRCFEYVRLWHAKRFGQRSLRSTHSYVDLEHLLGIWRFPKRNNCQTSVQQTATHTLAKGCYSTKKSGLAADCQALQLTPNDNEHPTHKLHGCPTLVRKGASAIIVHTGLRTLHLLQVPKGNGISGILLRALHLHARKNMQCVKGLRRAAGPVLMDVFLLSVFCLGCMKN